MMLSEQKVFSTHLFDGIAPDAITKLCLKSLAIELQPGQQLINRSDESRNVYFLIHGRLLCVLWTGDGKELVFGRTLPGDYVGELSAIDNQPRSLSIYAQVPSQVLVVSQQEFLQFVDQEPLFRSRVLQRLTALVRRLTEQSYQKTIFSVEQRVRMYLSVLMMDVGGFPNGSVLHDIPTHAEIASTIGTNREAVSRAMMRLKARGIIETGRQRLKILRPDELLSDVPS